MCEVRALLPARGWVVAVLMALGGWLAAARGADLTTLDGKIYRQVTVTQVEPDALRIAHADGAARLVYESLPEAVRRQHFDPAKVAAFRQQAAEEQRLAAERAAALRQQQAEAAARTAALERAELAAQEQRAAALRETARLAEEEKTATQRRKDLTLLGGGALGLIAGVVFYFIPTLVGLRKSNVLAIFVLNFFLGWTCFGWVVALVWACTRDSALEIFARQQLEKNRRTAPLELEPPPPREPPRYLDSK